MPKFPLVVLATRIRAVIAARSSLLEPSPSLSTRADSRYKLYRNVLIRIMRVQYIEHNAGSPFLRDYVSVDYRRRNTPPLDRRLAKAVERSKAPAISRAVAVLRLLADSDASLGVHSIAQELGLAL